MAPPHQDDRCEVFHGIEGKLIDEGIAVEAAYGFGDQVSVRFFAHNASDADRASAADSVFNDDRLSQYFLNALRQGAQMTSVAPPAGKGTTKVIEAFGKPAV